MDKIYLVAFNTVKESIRDKILYIVVFAAIGLLMLSMMIGQWAVFNQYYVTQSVSLSLTSISGLAVSIFVGIGLIQKEIQKKTVLTLLAKPIARHQFVIGKYVGLLVLLALHVLIMGTLILGVLWSQDMPIKPMYFTAIALLYFEIALVTSVAVLFSSFSTPILSSLFTVGFFMAGHLSSDLMNQVATSSKITGVENSPIFEVFAKVIYYVFPNLDQYVMTPYLVYDIAVPSGYYLQTLGGGALYILLFMSIASWWFSRRDFN